MKNDGGFIYEEPEGLSEDDERLLECLKHTDQVDPVTGRRAKQINPLNKKNLSKEELETFLLDF